MHIQTKALMLTFGTGLAKTLVHGPRWYMKTLHWVVRIF